MKKIILTATALLICGVALAQNVGLGVGQPQYPANNTYLPNGAALAITNRISGLGSANLIFSITTTNCAAGVSNPGTITLQQSVDGVNWSSYGTMVFTTAGTTPTTTITNIATAGVGYFRTTTIDNSGNAATGAVTIAVTKDATSTTVVGNTVKVGATSYTPSVKAGATQVVLTKHDSTISNLVKAATTQVTLTLQKSGVVTNIDTVNGITNVFNAVTNVTANVVWGFASTTAGVATNDVIATINTNSTVNTVWGHASTTPDVLALTPQ